MENLTASALSGVPSWNFTPLRSLKGYWSPSFEMVHDSARPGTSCVLSSGKVTSVSTTRRPTRFELRSVTWAGSRFTGSATRPTTSVPAGCAGASAGTPSARSTTTTASQALCILIASLRASAASDPEQRRRVGARHPVQLRVAHAELAEPLHERHEPVDRRLQRRGAHVTGENRALGAHRLDGGRHLLDGGAAPRLESRDRGLRPEEDTDVRVLDERAELRRLLLFVDRHVDGVIVGVRAHELLHAGRLRLADERERLRGRQVARLEHEVVLRAQPQHLLHRRHELRAIEDLDVRCCDLEALVVIARVDAGQPDHAAELLGAGAAKVRHRLHGGGIHTAARMVHDEAAVDLDTGHRRV